MYQLELVQCMVCRFTGEQKTSLLAHHAAVANLVDMIKLWQSVDHVPACKFPETTEV
jgi:hypothetical protein